MGKIINMIKKRLAAAVGISILAAPSIFLGGAALAVSQWNLNGSYNIDFTCVTGCSDTYTHDATVSGQNSSGDFNVSGGYPAGGPHSTAWSGTGNVSGNAVTMSVDYNEGAPNTHMNMTGSVAPDGTMSGTWTDNFPNGTGSRSGTWATSSGTATGGSNSTIVVTPANQQGWTTNAPLADNRPGASVNYIFDSTSPAPNGALQLLTDTAASKAQYMHPSNTALSSVNELSYYTKQVAPAGAVADPSYQLVTFLNGGTSGFSTLVFEPYQNPGNNGNATVLNNAWQQWDVDQGLFWSTRTVTCSNGTINGTAGGPATYTLSQIQSACPNAVVAGFGVNAGTNNPAYNVETDLFDFNGTTYNFELTNTPTDKNQCKNGGYVNYTDQNGNAFKNQGQCVSFVNGRGNKTVVNNKNTVNITNVNTQNAKSGKATVKNNSTGGNATSGGASNSNSTTNNVNVSNNPTF